MSQAKMIESRAVRKETVNITALEGLPYGLREEQIRLATGKQQGARRSPRLTCLHTGIALIGQGVEAQEPF